MPETRFATNGKWEMWDCSSTVGGIHVVPIDDWVEHAFSTGCICEPRIEIENGSTIVVHDAADGRD